METADAQAMHETVGDSHEHRHAEHAAHHDHDHDHGHENPMSPEEAVRSLLLLTQVALDADDYESAVEASASVLQIEDNEIALYNLASFYARGLGVRRDFVEAARLFHRAELLGNERAGKLCAKCMLDYLCDGFENKSAADLYAAMALFVARVYPEASDPKQETCRGLLAIALTFLNKGAVEEAAKVLRAAAEFGGNQDAQHYLDELSGTESER